MVKTLQRKFLFASMLAVTILLVTLVGAINISYCYSVYSRERNMLEMLCETDGRPEGPERFRDPNREDAGSTDTGINSEAGLENGQIRDHSGRTDTEQADQAGGLMSGSGRNGFLKHGMSMDEALSIRFFAVWFEENGQAVLTDTSRIYAVSGEEAEEMAQVIVSSGKNTGVYQGFRYLIEEKDCTLSIEAEPVTAAKILVAMDISSDRRDMLRILAISVLIAALCWAAMLLPVNALSRRAIAPTAMSIERQKEFVTNAGHELKTPLAIIQANTDALELHAGESKWTRNIRAQTVRLNVLMQNLLTLSRMDENSLKLEKKPFAINPLLGEVWEDFAEPAAGKKLSVQILAEEDLDLKVLANRDSIAQLLSILFDNAVKYTPHGGQIEVRAVVSHDKVDLIQSNTVAVEEGSNVLAEDPDRLFERFYRADSDRSRKKGGYGIGLSAARAIAGANGGTIHASAAGNRIIFTVSLRKASG